MSTIAKTNLSKIILACATVLILVFGMSISSYAASGSINGNTTQATSSIKEKSASATTYYAGPNGTASVSSTYTYVNSNGQKATSSKSNGYIGSVTVKFTAPSNGHSVSISSSHKVAANNQTWTARTSATYSE